ncbi:nuclear transport factor 2 family protein [Streptomyces profundus]|uniref:nuclear transport factor 2 family protein n=1 Tax=Streptomyces profundus TaxID=2867410 RepID=UPI001D169FE5|nr:nuclear transport factor 2 family protein [Streptomyces sp. MA3_2.13]UED86505.1 nuclear transport factor 2 family protein [Streptomyces sp. MA3_2.13]
MFLFHAFVRRVTVPLLYWHVSRGRSWMVLALCTGDVRNSADGDSCLGGARTGRRSYGAWFGRMFRLTRSIRPRATEVRVEGSPIRSTVVVRWTDPVTAHDGVVFPNEGVHTLTLRWGRIATVHQAWDESVVRKACEHAAALGYQEATEPPLTS